MAELTLNPFVVGLLAAGAHFADREREVARIARAWREPGAKLIVYGDRRLGKSSALERAAEEVRRSGSGVAIASFATASDPAEAAQRVLEAAREQVGRNWREFLEQVARSVQATLEVSPSLDPSGLPTIRFGFDLKRADAATKLLPDVLDAIDEQVGGRGGALGLGLDEFQRIHEWGGEDAEWALRDSMQRHRSLSYVLAGSRRSLIEAMVTDKGRALWKLADVLPFGPIGDELLVDWITERSGATVVAISGDAARLIVAAARPRTRDVVQLARATWFQAARSGLATIHDVREAFGRIVADQGELYRVIWAKLDAREQAVLRAFAAEPGVQIMAAATLDRYQLGPKSSVHGAVERLVAGEHLTRGESGYGFDDPFFRRWVQVHALPDIGLAAPELLAVQN